MNHTPLWYLPNIAMEITIFNRQFNYQWAIFHSYAMLNYGYIWALEFHSTECEPSTLSGYRYLFVAPCIATSSYTHDMDGPWCQWTADPGGDIGGRIIGESVGTNQEQQGYRLPANRVSNKETNMVRLSVAPVMTLLYIFKPQAAGEYQEADRYGRPTGFGDGLWTAELFHRTHPILL